eukprot:1162150-Pelagomonas_calceolata.AAC.14
MRSHPSVDVGRGLEGAIPNGCGLVLKGPQGAIPNGWTSSFSGGLWEAVPTWEARKSDKARHVGSLLIGGPNMLRAF